MTSFYVINSPLVNYFFYNFTTTAGGPNLPLDGGFIFFFADEDHSLMLPTYSDVSDPANPVVNTNPIELNVVGACPIFYLEDREYYIVITDKNGDLDNPVWTIEHYNPSGAAGNADFSTLNYAPNGQFLIHNDLPAVGDFTEGEIREAITPLAYGGYTFETDESTTSVNKVTFERYDEWAANPPSNPQFSVRIECTDPDTGDSKKDWALTFPDVNRFASATQQYTFGIAGIDNFGGSLPLDLILIKNFGTGGDAQTETILTTFILDSVEKNFYFSFVFGTNEGKVIGADGDDYVKLVLRAPVNEASDFNLVNEQLRPGTLVNPVYPETTQIQDVSAALGGGFPIPNPDGSDLALPPLLTKDGWGYDHSQVSKIFLTSYDIPKFGELACDGEKYPYDGYSDDGIPYYRLGDSIWNDVEKYFLFGGGLEFASAQVIFSAGQNLKITNNTGGAVAAPSDGSAPTGFTFSNIHIGADYGFKAYYSSASVIVEIQTEGPYTAPDAGTSGFPVFVERISARYKGIFYVSQITSPTGLEGKYFALSNTTTSFYVWFKVDGVGADPAPGGTGILVNLLSSYSPPETAQCIAEAISGKQSTNIICTAASTVPASSFFNLETSDLQGYYVWYEKDGVGVDPAPSSKIGIKVLISSSMTNAQVATETFIAINKKYFATPKPNGAFFRIKDNGAGIDPDVMLRFNLFSNSFGDRVGTFQFDEVISHLHNYNLTILQPAANTIPVTGGSTEVADIVASTTSYGGNQTYPVNMYVNCIIKY